MSFSDIVKRYTYCEDEFGNVYRCGNSSWDNWVRWLVLGIILVLFFFFFILLSCLSARRRRRSGARPFYGTGWAAHNYNPPTYQQSQQQPYYTPAGNAGYNPPPQYGNQNQNQNQGYYGGQRGDVELQQPQQAYTGGNDYAPPAGPPPPKR